MTVFLCDLYVVTRHKCKSPAEFFTAEKRALLPFGAATPDPDRGDPQAVKDGQDSSKEKSVVFMQAKAKKPEKRHRRTKLWRPDPVIP